MSYLNCRQGCSIPVVLSLLSCSGRPASVSYPDSCIPSAISGFPFPLSCPGFPVLTVLSRLSCPGCPIPAVHQLSCPGCPVPASLSSLSCPSFPVLAVLSRQSFSSYSAQTPLSTALLTPLSSPGSPVLSVLSRPPIQADLSRLLSCPVFVYFRRRFSRKAKSNFSENCPESTTSWWRFCVFIPHC
jgi:hypothetical protein